MVDGLRLRIAAALGLAPLLLAGAAGCVVRSLDDGTDDGAGDASAGEGTGSTSASGSMSAEGTSAMTTISGSEDDGTDDGTVVACVLSNSWLEWELWLPADGECVCDETCQAQALAEWNELNCCDSCSYGFGAVQCTELLGGQCHFVVTMTEEICGEGRPLLIDGCARTAEACARSDWGQASITPHVDELEATQRELLAESWARTALAEHASVASFARFGLDLAALGAPPELLADTAHAMQDEIRHAQLAFALASTYAGRSIGPGPLPMHGLAAGGSAEAIVRAAVREGCIEETLAAAQAELAAHRATDPIVRAVLTAIADDEARHAVLAWRFVDWAVQRDASLATIVREELRRALDAAAEASDDALELPPTEDEVLSAHGVVPEGLRLRLRARCLRGTIRPCAAAMLHGRARAEAATSQA